MVEYLIAFCLRTVMALNLTGLATYIPLIFRGCYKNINCSLMFEKRESMDIF